MDLELQGRTVIVTGAARGLGKGTAQAFALEGAQIVVADLNREEGRHTAESIEQAGGKAAFIEVDVSSEANAMAMAELTIQEFGRIDALVDFAGVPYQSGFQDSTIEQWREQFRVHLDGAFLCAKAVVPHMIRQHYGKIVLVGSFAAYTSPQAPYCLAKAAVMVFTRGLARELVGKNINVNCICPGFIRTPMMDVNWPTEEDKENLAKTIPIGRLGEVEDIANLVLFLCSDCSKHITGVNIDINGGQVIQW